MPEAKRPDTFLPLPHDALFILLALASQPLHGYGIIRDVDARSDGETVLQTGALYRMLRRLVRDEMIEACVAPDDKPVDPRRQYYRLTRRGRMVLDAEVERMSRVVRAARLIEAGKKPRLS